MLTEQQKDDLVNQTISYWHALYENIARENTELKIINNELRLKVQILEFKLDKFIQKENK
jgi:hypothetical protein